MGSLTSVKTAGFFKNKRGTGVDALEDGANGDDATLLRDGHGAAEPVEKLLAFNVVSKLVESVAAAYFFMENNSVAACLPLQPSL